MFKKQNINIPRQQAFLPPFKSAELLTKAFQMTGVGFEWVLVDKPIDGTLFIFASSPGQADIPEDGFGWMDDESYQRFVLENGIEIEIFSRNLGFAPGESHATVKRKRYRLAKNGDLQLMHYTRSQVDKTTPAVQMHLVKQRPRAPGMAPPGIQSPARGGPARTAEQTRKIQYQKMRQAPQVKIIDDDREPSGDELDKGFGRLLALERYKRNHLFFEQIFSAHATKNLTSPKLFADCSKERLESVKQMQADLDKEMTEAEQKYRKDIENHKKKSVEEWKLIHELKHRKKAKVAA